MSECQICTLKYTKARRKELVCRYCKFSTCATCFFNYNNNSEKETNCMNCKEYIFLSDFKDHMSAKAYNTLEKKCLKEFIFNEEKKILTDTKLKLALQNKKKELQKSIDNTNGHLKEAMARIIQEKIANLSVDNFKLCQNIDCKKYAYRDDDTNFYYCESCDGHICARCEENIESDNISGHECDGQILNSLKSIDKETKPCPTCGIKIFKIDGCSQVMCTECKTFFDFNTGLKEREDEPRHARGYIDTFDILEKEVIGDKLYEAFESSKFLQKEFDLWTKDDYKSIISVDNYARTWSAIMINCRSAILRTINKCTDFKLLNEQNRIRFINDEISESYYKTLSFNKFIYCKEKLELCKMLCKFHFDLKVIFNEEFRKYINDNLSDKQCHKNIESAIMGVIDKYFYGQFKISKKGLTFKNMTSQLSKATMTYGKDKQIYIDRLRNNASEFL